MRYLDIDVRTHLPQDKDGRRATARSKSKVERPFRTVKEMHETLYHFHEPKDEEEANAWLLNFLTAKVDFVMKDGIVYRDSRCRRDISARATDERKTSLDVCNVTATLLRYLISGRQE